MAAETVIRKILVSLKDFKVFWQENEPYSYALTSSGFPPVLLEEEEWIFSNDKVALLKELMQYTRQKMKIVKAPFNRAGKSVLRPDGLSDWKIINFPVEWNCMDSDLFTPEGHLTCSVIKAVKEPGHKINEELVEQAFFLCLEQKMKSMGYLLFKPGQGARRAAVQRYLKEWEADESDAGLL